MRPWLDSKSPGRDESRRSESSLIISDPPLEYCALQLADFWFTTDRHLVRGLSSSDRSTRLKTLRRAATAFKVARTLPTAYDEGRGVPRLNPALRILEANTRRRIKPDEAKTVVRRVREELGGAYGGRETLSAVTKFLWLRVPDVFVIYDSQARAALGTPNGDYDAYLEQWLDRYARRRDNIRRACSALQTVRRYLSCGNIISQREVREVVAEEWFWRRVYDIHLWRSGSRTIA